MDTVDGRQPSGAAPPGPTPGDPEAPLEVDDLRAPRGPAVLDSLPSAVALVDGEGVVVAVNRSWEALAAEDPAMDLPGVGGGLLERWSSGAGLPSDDEPTGEHSTALPLLAVHGFDAERAALAGGLRGVLEGHLPTCAAERTTDAGEDGQRRYLVRASRCDDAGVRAVVAIDDVTEMTKLQQRLAHAAFHDQLTGLANRALLHDRLERSVALSRRTGRRVAVLFLDLDRFKIINDSLGHRAGDDLLVQVSDRLRRCVRPNDTVARLGGDEFVVLLDDVGDDLVVVAAAERILEVLEPPFTLADRETYVGTSIGIALGRGGELDADALLTRADVAMYRAKAAGRGTWQRYDPSMDADASARLQLETDLRRALERNELELHYQPLVDLRSGQVRAVEALLRWAHPSLGVLTPEVFIPLAEETGSIVRIGRWALAEACRTVRRWQQRWPEHSRLRVHVNLSPVQLQQSDLANDVEAALFASRLPASSVCLELTESVALDDPSTLHPAITRLSRLGVTLAMDDFGTGYSSLRVLRDLPVDIVKVDRSFIEDAIAGETSMVEGIVALAHTLNLVAVGEGVETTDQLRWLRRAGCDLVQGHLLSPAVPAEEATDLLRAWARRSPVHSARP